MRALILKTEREPLRRLRLHGVIERIAHTHRYRVTALGQCICLILSKRYARVLRPVVAGNLSEYSTPSTMVNGVLRLLLKNWLTV